ncbi:hydrolase [Streptomyces sp. NBC_00121]|uniref:hydrolase n=1 Tax=unclassified Streptomyces TaxID=2593676 RepID=UPI002DD7C2D6|nr:hydrolase [Streptomyces sp. NBC_01760]WSC74044.1 hydrolase [Streptomyces sp. NBC_01760]
MVNTAAVKANPASSLLSPENSVLLLVDHQPQMFFGTTSADRGEIINATVGLAKAAKVFDVPVVLTTVASKSFSGPMVSQLAEVYPDIEPIDRTTMNCWEDQRVVDAVKATGRPKIVMAGLWTEVCIALASLSAVEQGYEVYVPTDACGGVSVDAHENAVRRMVQNGVVPTTWLTTLLEWQRDWGRTETYDPVADVVMQHAGAYGVGVFYARAMLGGHSTG